LVALRAALGQPSAASFVFALGLGIVGIFVLRAAALLGIQWIGLAFRRRLQFRLMGRLFRSYLAQPMAWHFANGSPRMINNLGLNVPHVCLHIVVGSLEILGGAITFAILTGTMMWLRPVETVVAILCIAAFATIFLTALRARMLAWAQAQTAASQGQWAAITEPLRGIRIVKIHALEEFFARRLDRNANILLGVTIRQSMARQVPYHLLQVALVAGVILSVSAAFAAGADAAKFIPTMLLFTGAALRLIPVVLAIMNDLQQLRSSEPALAQIRADMLARPPASKTQTAAAVAPSAFRSLELDNVGFAYAPEAPRVLRDINLRLQSGDQIALTGPSGAGKSTLVEILLGLLAPSAGSVRLDGAAVDSVPRELFSYVPQDSFLVHDSFARNIALGDAPIDLARLREAIADASLTGVVERLPQGIDTVVAEGGSGFSGGERQRIGIARALYRQSPIVVMDEPTSALDAMTEADVSATLARLKGRRTVVLIAHRLSTVRSFERILFMESGRVLAQGDFKTLYLQQSRFRAMVDLLSMDMDKTAL
jgi:ABC-type multidrug transport system fused ATPase/permease subunit